MNTHNYATNSSFHPRMIASIAFIAVGLSALIGWIATWVQQTWGYGVGGISAMTIFGLLFFVFNKWLWKIALLRRLLLVPNLNGRWRIQGKTIKRDGEDVSFDWEGTIDITQSWSGIVVVLRTKLSSSRSIAASLYRYTGEGYRLIYHYSNEPKADQSALKRHCGLCDLMFDEDLRQAEGSYFTDRDRLTTGTMQLTKEISSDESS